MLLAADGQGGSGLQLEKVGHFSLAIEQWMILLLFILVRVIGSALINKILSSVGDLKNVLVIVSLLEALAFNNPVISTMIIVQEEITTQCFFTSDVTEKFWGDSILNIHTYTLFLAVLMLKCTHGQVPGYCRHEAEECIYFRLHSLCIPQRGGGGGR